MSICLVYEWYPPMGQYADEDMMKQNISNHSSEESMHTQEKTS